MDATEIHNMLTRLEHLPDRIARWEVETGNDWSGDESVWVWAYVDDERLIKISSIDRQELRREIREAVRRAARESVENIYVRFRGASEAVPQAV
jgi:hypothetical protein